MEFRKTTVGEGSLKLETYEEKFGNRTEEEIKQDEQAMEVFVSTESNRLDNAVEQSSGPEKGKKLKKVLKAMTIGAVMLTTVLGNSVVSAKMNSDFSNQQQEVVTTQYSEQVGDMAEKGNITEDSVLSTEAQYEAEEARLKAEISELRTQNEITEARNNQMRQNIEQLQAKINKTKEKIQAGEGSVKDIQLEIDSATSEYINRQAELTQIQTETARAKQDYIDKSIDSMKKTYDLDGQIRFLENVSGDLEEQVDQLAKINQSIKL
jgi:chromosome segregation ATPase